MWGNTWQTCEEILGKHVRKYLANMWLTFWFDFYIFYSWIYGTVDSIFSLLKGVAGYSKNVGVLNIEFATQDLQIFKKFKCLKWIRKKFSTTLHNQFNYLTSPVTPFKPLFHQDSRYLYFSSWIILPRLFFFKFQNLILLQSNPIKIERRPLRIIYSSL